MSRILLVHGIGQQYKGPESLHAEWRPALNDGIMIAGGCTIADKDVKVAFYGDIFRPGGRNLGEPDLDASDLVSEFDRGLLLSWWAAASSADPAVPGPAARTRLRTPYHAQRALAALLHSPFFAGITERGLILNLRQVRRYFTEPSLRQLITDRVSRCVTPRTRVIIGHSLGSVVAYEALCAHPEWTVNAFISLGSPLGVRGLIFDRLQPPPRDGRGSWPGKAHTWVNIADHGDVVATEKLLSPLFGPKVIDLKVYNGSRAHDIRPYLTTRETGSAIKEALSSLTEKVD